MEARVGIEPTIEDLQSSALPLGDRAIADAIGSSRCRSPMSSSELSSKFYFVIRRSMALFIPVSTFRRIVRDYPIVEACQSPQIRLSCPTFRRSGRVAECD